MYRIIDTTIALNSWAISNLLALWQSRVNIKFIERAKPINDNTHRVSLYVFHTHVFGECLFASCLKAKEFVVPEKYTLLVHIKWRVEMVERQAIADETTNAAFGVIKLDADWLRCLCARFIGK